MELGGDKGFSPQSRRGHGELPTIKRILEAALGVEPKREAGKRGDFEEFCGVWTEDDLPEFMEKTKELCKVDLGDWR
jgi:hypothetical protein